MTPQQSAQTATGDDAGPEVGGKVAWLRAGQDLLRTGGINAVKIHALRRETGLTTGSFYHHFDGMAQYLQALAEFWGGDTPEHLLEADNPDPKQRLRKLASIAPRESLRSLDMAMRDWAGSDPDAAAAVERVDHALLTYVASAFVDLGFDETDSRIRAHAWLAIGVARVRTPWAVGQDMPERLIDMLSRPG